MVMNSPTMTAKCLCPKGFIIHANGVTCVDENECSNDNGGCDGHCTNTIGSYQCSCLEGYVLSSDSHSCEGT